MKVIFIILIFSFISCSKQEYVKEFYEDGSLKVKYQINNKNLLHGKFKGYNEEGVLVVESYYKKGKKDGTTQVYRDDGRLKWAGNFKKGKEDGELKFYYENGQLSSVQNYKDGERNGESRFYYENGNLEVLGSYKNGKEHSSFYIFNEKEKVNKIERYEEGKLLSWLKIDPVVKEKLSAYSWIKVIPDNGEELHIREGIEITIEKHGESEGIEEVQITSICVNRNPTIQKQEYVKFVNGIAEYYFKPQELDAHPGQRCIMTFSVFSSGNEQWDMIAHDIEFHLIDDQKLSP